MTQEMTERKKNIKLCHVIPMDMGLCFYDSSVSAISVDASLYKILNTEGLNVDKAEYGKRDLESIEKIKKFLAKVKKEIVKSENPHIKTAVIEEDFPEIPGCILHIRVTPKMALYLCINGTAVFCEYGDRIEVEDKNYFSLPLFYERQLYEDDYCLSDERSERKADVYDMADILWACAGSDRLRSYSGSEKFRNHGISYALALAVIDIPDFSIDKVDATLRKNCRAIIDTSAFNNVLDKEQWPHIKDRIDHDDYSDLELKQLSETLVYADSWSGVLIAGDMEKNIHCFDWLMEFEVYLQSRWLLYEAFSEDLLRNDYTTIQLEQIKNMVELSKMKLDNDISSNMEQVRHNMRASLVKTSDINQIYTRMVGILTNQLKMTTLKDEKKKGRYAFVSEASLFIVAVLQIRSVIQEILATQSFSLNAIMGDIIILVLCIAGIWIMSKGR